MDRWILCKLVLYGVKVSVNSGMAISSSLDTWFRSIDWILVGSIFNLKTKFQNPKELSIWMFWEYFFNHFKIRNRKEAKTSISWNLTIEWLWCCSTVFYTTMVKLVLNFGATLKVYKLGLKCLCMCMCVFVLGW